jgi:hypothetical protein
MMRRLTGIFERSPDAALKFDTEFDRALADCASSAALGNWSLPNSQIPAAEISFHFDLPGEG